MLGKAFSAEHIKNLSIAHKGTPAWNKGKTGIYSAEVIEKMRATGKNRHPYWLGKNRAPFTEEWKNNLKNARANVVMSEETKRKISEHHKKKVAEGTYHTWKGGLTPIHQRIRNSKELRDWRKSIFERDDYRCFDCGVRSGETGHEVRLEAHHIYSFSEYPRLRFDFDNGITLCHECHTRTKNFGFKLSNRIRVS